VVAEVPGGRLPRHDVDALFGATLVTGLQAGTVVLTGPAPPAVLDARTYQRLTVDLVTNGAAVVADLSGDHLRAVVEAQPTVLTADCEELVEAGIASSTDASDLVEGIQRLRGEGVGHVVVTRHEDPVLASIEERLVAAQGPRLQELDSRGSGDSLTAALSVSLARGDDLAEALRFGTAAGALNVTRRGLGSGARNEIERLASLVTVRDL
jgi:1-phosphofructokinase